MLVGPFTSRGALFGKGSLAAVEHKMAFLEERHKVIANNIANVETRFYKTEDLPFDEFDTMLRESMNRRDEKHVKIFEMKLDRNVYQHGDPKEGFDVRNPKLSVLRHGDNNVDIDREVANLSRNEMMFKTMTTLAKKNYDLLRSTIRETP
jgi:flagellar basal-body rod protein FlgB